MECLNKLKLNLVVIRHIFGRIGVRDFADPNCDVLASLLCTELHALYCSNGLLCHASNVIVVAVLSRALALQRRLSVIARKKTGVKVNFTVRFHHHVFLG
jgi:hypothetical protein